MIILEHLSHNSKNPKQEQPTYHIQNTTTKMTATIMQNTQQLQATTTTTSTKTTVNVSSRRTSRVTFDQDVVTDVHYFESPNTVARKELFYQSQDYVQFRAQFQLYKVQQARKTSLQTQYRKQMVYKQAMPVQRLMATPQYRIPTLPRGCAQMA